MAGLVALPIYTPPGGYPSLPITPLAAAVVFTAADAVSNTFVSTGRELLLVQNTGAAATVTVTSVADQINRTGDITAYSLPIGSGTPTFAVLGPFPAQGWKQSNGTIIVAASTTGIAFAVIRLPSVA